MSSPTAPGAPDPAHPHHTSPPASELPVSLTSFVGRERELAEIVALLDRPDVRLLTLTGPGGVGKTRLAIEVARKLAPDFADGVAFVPLSSVRDSNLAPAAVARAVGVRGSGSLAGRLAGQHLLLLLDNVEHLLNQAPFWLVELLGSCPRLTVLATSREALRISGEHRYLVHPLPLPDGQATIDQPLADAATLFEQRAAALRPEFRVTERDIAEVAAICHAVDGLPLGIELAASRILLLTPKEIASHLSDRLRLLAGGPRDAPERMRSLRAAIDWSHDLLSPDERRLFRQLSVFDGGFDLAAASAVIEPGATDLVSAIGSLVDKSLLRVTIPEDGGEARYFLLETLREYGLEQLAASGEESSVRERHATWYLELAGAFAPRRELGEQSVPAAVERLDEEYGNLRAALSWLDDSGREAELTVSAMRMRSFWYLTERYGEALHWYERAKATDDATRIALLRMTGQMTLLVGRGGGAQLLEASLALARAAGDQQQEAQALFHLALMAEDEGDYAPAARGFSRARELFAVSGNPVAAIQSEYHLGVIAYGQGRLDDAERLLRSAIAAGEAVNDPLLPAWCTTYLMLVACQRNDLDGALALLRAGPTPLGVPALRHHLPDYLATAAVIAAGSGSHALAARLLGASRRSGYRFNLPERLAYERAEATARQRIGDAEFEREQANGRRMSTATVEAELGLLATGTRSGASPDPGVAAGIPVLTGREREVLRLLADGLTNREIANALYVSLRTVATHVDHILTKLGVRSRTAAVAFAVRNGLA